MTSRESQTSARVWATSFGAVLGFLAGLWLIMAPFALDYRAAGGDLDRHGTTVFVGCAVLVCSLVHGMAPRESPWLPPVLFVVGAWLVVAPLVAPYPEGGRAAVSNTVSGGVVVLAALSAVIGAKWGGAPGRERRGGSSRDDLPGASA